MSRYEIIDFSNAHSVALFNRMTRELYARLSALEQLQGYALQSTAVARAASAEEDQTSQTEGE